MLQQGVHMFKEAWNQGPSGPDSAPGTQGPPGQGAGGRAGLHAGLVGLVWQRLLSTGPPQHLTMAPPRPSWPCGLSLPVLKDHAGCSLLAPTAPQPLPGLGLHPTGPVQPHTADVHFSRSRRPAVSGEGLLLSRDGRPHAGSSRGRRGEGALSGIP